MSSSPKLAAQPAPAADLPRHDQLLQVPAGVPDPRDPRGVRHALGTLLALGLAAAVAGARSFVVIGEWVSVQPDTVLAVLGADGARPSESAIRRAFARVDAEVLDRVIGAFLWTRTHLVDQRRVIAIDGKTVRGARSRDRDAPHLVAALDHRAGAVLGQFAVASKSNEIPCARDLLACFDLNEVVVTIDAMHTQTDTATAITSAGGDFVFTVKGNQSRLYAKLKKLPWAAVPAHTATTTGGPAGPAHHQGRRRPGLDHLPRRGAGRPAPPHRHPRRETHRMATTCTASTGTLTATTCSSTCGAAPSASQ